MVFCPQFFCLFILTYISKPSCVFLDILFWHSDHLFSKPYVFFWTFYSGILTLYILIFRLRFRCNSCDFIFVPYYLATLTVPYYLVKLWQLLQCHTWLTTATLSVPYWSSQTVIDFSIWSHGTLTVPTPLCWHSYSAKGFRSFSRFFLTWNLQGSV